MIPGSVFQRFAVYGKNGKLDRNASLAQFAEGFDEWADRQKGIGPAIIEVLTHYPRLGEGRLIDFVTMQLKMEPTQETKALIQATLLEMEKAGKIAYKTTENGDRRGRGAGFSLVENAPPPAPTQVPTGRSSKHPSRTMRAAQS